MVYDRTCKGYGPLPGLTTSWRAGAWFYKGLRRLDGWYGASSWIEALTWLCEYRRDEPISEFQYWGHGRWGKLMMDGEPLDSEAMEQGHTLYPLLEKLEGRLNRSSLLWFRTCETFGAQIGQDFAERVVNFFDCKAAGHTYVIGPWQSGLHTLSPGQKPNWSIAEGLPEGHRPEDPLPDKALWSTPTAPNTISCLTGRIPIGF